jgi:hypothetical protein
MKTRIYTPAQLDALLVVAPVGLCDPEPSDAIVELDIDSADFVGRALLMGVYTDGRFDVLLADDSEIHTLWLADCKVFVDQDEALDVNDKAHSMHW